MNRPLVIVRPEPGCSETLRAAEALGIEAIAAPLFGIEPVAWEPADPGQFDGILAGSANAFRHAGDGLAALRNLPVHAVGDRTAGAARAAGLGVAHVGKGSLQNLLEALTPPLRLLRLSGEVRVDLALPDGVSVEDRVVYRAVPLDLAAEAARALSQGAVVALHSGEAARHFSGEVDRRDIGRGQIAIAALAPRIAGAAGKGWRSVRTAPRVTDDALLALAAEMCQ